MSSLSFSKLKSYLSFGISGDNNNNNTDYKNSKSKGTALFDTLDPEVGFKLQLDSTGSNNNNSSSSSGAKSSNLPELKVHVIGARHLPNSFGLKLVEGYIIKVKLFPGTTRYDSNIQTSSWPTFNETFTFPLGSSTKSSFKSKIKDVSNASQTLPEKLFKGHFVVLTVFALLELPPGALPTMKHKLQQLKRKGSLLLNEKPTGEKSSNDDKDKVEIMKLTTSETRRNIGSVTCFLDPKIFEENVRTKQFVTEELWLPIKDITVSHSSTSKLAHTLNTSTKGQIEIIMEICEPEPLLDNDENDVTTSSAAVSTVATSARLSSRKKSDANSHSVIDNDKTKNHWSLSDVRKKITGQNKKDKYKGMCFKIITSKMRCSIKVKEELENVGGPIYVKTTIFEHDILSSSWKSDVFAPSLSTRWNPEESTLIVPLVDDNSLNNISIKISIATKTKMGKKIFLGTLLMGPQSQDLKLEHWKNMLANKGTPISMWHNFE